MLCHRDVYEGLTLPTGLGARPTPFATRDQDGFQLSRKAEGTKTTLVLCLVTCKGVTYSTGVPSSLVLALFWNGRAAPRIHQVPRRVYRKDRSGKPSQCRNLVLTLMIPGDD